MSETEAMGWSPLQCVIGKAEVGGNGKRVRIEGYGLGEKGQSLPYMSRDKIENAGRLIRQSSCANHLSADLGVPIKEIHIAFVKLDPGIVAQHKDEAFKAEEHLTKLAEGQDDWKTVTLPEEQGRKWDWVLWKYEGDAGLSEGDWAAVARAGTLLRLPCCTPLIH